MLPSSTDVSTIENCHVDQEQQHDEDIVQQAEQPEHSFRYDIKWREEVQDGRGEDHEHSHAEHENQPANGEELADEVSQEHGQVAHVIPELQPQQDSIHGAPTKHSS